MRSVTGLIMGCGLLAAAGAAQANEPVSPLGWGAAVKTPHPDTAKSVPAAGKAPASATPAAGNAATPPPSAEPVATGALTPQGASQSIAFADWVLSCRPLAGKQLCSLSQTIRDAKDRRIIQIVAKRAGQAAYLELNVPLGISIPYGVSLDLSEAVKVPAQLADCDAAGCRSVIALTDVIVAQIKAAKGLAVTFQDSKSGKIISISGSPKGFEQGIAMVLATP